MIGVSGVDRGVFFWSWWYLLRTAAFCFFKASMERQGTVFIRGVFSFNLCRPGDGCNGSRVMVARHVSVGRCAQMAQHWPCFVFCCITAGGSGLRWVLCVEAGPASDRKLWPCRKQHGRRRCWTRALVLIESAKPVPHQTHGLAQAVQHLTSLLLFHLYPGPPLLPVCVLA